MTAALGVMLDKAANTQTFFGGGEVENMSKQVASSKNHHSNDVSCLKVNNSGDRQWAASGQVGKNAAIFVWNTQTGEKRQRMALAKNARAVAAIAISKDGEYVATADKHNDHNVIIWKGTDQLWGNKGGPDEIFDICFTQEDGKYDVFSAGKKHYMHWREDQKNKKGIFGSNPRTSFACICADDQGNTYSGGSNSLIYVWNGNSIKQTLNCHDAGFVGAINWVGGMLYSGGRDGKVYITDTSTMETQKGIEFGVLPRAIDVHDGNLVVGLKSGSIIECNIESGEMNTLMQSHNEGEAWGLAMDDGHIYSSGDDNQVKKWSPAERKCLDTAIVSEKEERARKNRASTLSRFPESQCSRGLAVSPSGHIAVCANDGKVTIRTTDDIHTVNFTLEDPNEWCEVAEYSPDGSHLAVGSHDTNIYIYETEGYSLVGTCSKHNATITCIDWSMDGSKIRSVCNAYELLFFDAPSGE